MVGGLVEREHELAVLADALRRARSGQGSTISVEGPAGIGKSALLRELTSRARAEGLEVLRGSGGRLEREFAFGVVRQLLERHVRPLDSVIRRHVLGGSASMGAEVLDLGQHAADTEDVGPAPLSPMAVLHADDARGARLHGLFWIVANLASLGPLALVVDDAQWSDEASLQFLTYLGRRLDDLPVVQVLGVRTDEAVDPPTLREVVTTDGHRRVRPAPLSIAGSAALVARRASVVPSAVAAEQLRDQTGGNPFLLHELAGQLAETGLPDWEALLSRPLVAPESVGRFVLDRLDSLGDDALRLAYATLVLGDGCRLAEAAEVAEVAPEAAVRALTDLTRTDLVAGTDEIAFRHALIASAVDGGLPAPDRSAWHLRAAGVLRRRSADPERIAAQLLASTPQGDPDDLAVLVHVGRRALANGAPEAARRLLQRAMDEGPQPDQAGAVLTDLGTAQLLAGSLDDAVATLDHAVRRSTHDAELVQRTLLLWVALLSSGQVGKGVSLLESTIADVAGRDEELSLTLEAEFVVAALFEPHLLGSVSKRLQALGELSGRTPAQRAALAVQTYLVQQDGVHSAEQVGDLAERAIGDGELIRENPIDPTKWVWPVGALIMTDRLARAEGLLALAETVTGPTASIEPSMLIVDLRSWLWFSQGRTADAEAEALGGLSRIADLPSTPVRRLQLTATMRWALRAMVARGHLAEAEQLLVRHGLDGLLEPGPRQSRLDAERGLLRLHQRRYDDALASALALRRANQQLGIEDVADGPWRPVAARALAALGRRSEAVAVADEQLELARRWALPRVVGEALQARALVEHDPVHRVELLEQAVQHHRLTPSPLAQAQTETDLGTALLRARRHAEGVAVLSAAHDLALTSEADGLVAVLREALSQAGVRPRRRPHSGIDALTPSERRIARLVATGSTNREVAQELFLSVRTVENTLHRTFTKLGVRSRRELRGLFRDTEPAPERP